MKIILQMTITSNGLIARKDGSVDWTLKGAWGNYSKFCKQLGNLIIGRKTYDAMPIEEFAENCTYVVITHDKKIPKKSSNVIFARNPKDAVELLEKKGFEKIGLGGGGVVNSSFMKENLIDEICLDIEPVILGKGIKLFADENFETKLKLIGTKKLSNNEVQLHYKVLK